MKQLNQDTYQPRGISSHLKLIRGRKKKRSEDEMDEGSDEDSDESMSSLEEENEAEMKKKLSGKKRKDVAKKESFKDSKKKEKTPTKSDPNMQLNIEDLAECFKHLELKLGEQGNREPPAQRLRSSLYCIMCGKLGHLV